MSAAAGLGREIEAIGAAVLRARGELEAGGAVDLAFLTSQVGVLCARLETIQAADGRALQPRILALIDDLGHLGREIDARLHDLRQGLNETARRIRAVGAYGGGEPRSR